MIKSVFPTASQIGFSRRGRTTFQEARAPVWPGRCVGWWVEYQRLGPAGRVESYADVVVTLYGTHAQALVALSEPLGVPTVTLANRVRARVAPTHGWVGSVIGNVFISSTSSFLPALNGIPDFKGGPDLSPAALLRIHRAIHAKVLRLR